MSETILREVVVIAVTLAAVITDIRRRQIPNALTMGAFAAGCVSWLGDGFPVFAANGVAAVVALAIGFGLFSIGVLGGGDAKLMAAVIAIMGRSFAFDFAVALAASAVLGSLAVLAARGRLFAFVGSFFRTARDLIRGGAPLEETDSRTLMPFAVIIMMATAGAIAFRALEQVGR